MESQPSARTTSTSSRSTSNNYRRRSIISNSTCFHPIEAALSKVFLATIRF